MNREQYLTHLNKEANFLLHYGRYVAQNHLGIHILPGWFGMVINLFAYMQKLDVEDGIHIQAIQIKEKFGGLRFYYSVVNTDSLDKEAAAPKLEAFKTMVEIAESQSLKKCQVCGKAGETIEDGWVKTRCAQHADWKYPDIYSDKDAT